MAFYSFEMILVGIILLTAMAFGGVKLWLNKRANSIQKTTLPDGTQSNSSLIDYNPEKKKNSNA